MNTIEESVYLAHLNLIRKEGFRPTIIVVLLYKGKVGLCQPKDYYGFEFPQGGIESGELPVETISREVREELGERFYQECCFPPIKVKNLFNVRYKMNVKGRLELHKGESVKPIGKEYMVFSAELEDNTQKIPQISQNEGTQFKRCVWTDLHQAKELIKKTKHIVKREIALRAINELIKNVSIA